ncbi:MAG TPA: hypothetical protein VL306_00815 [Methylomirabilota bacterium]|jgi:glucose uptake protein GlcU|nr:hypothetical protein [Methylomirabilota bacterium]
MKKKIIYLYTILLSVFQASHALAIENPAPGLFVNSVGDNSVKGILLFAIENILLPIVGIIAILFVIIGGFQLITARGNEEQAEAGKKTLTNAIIGLVVVILSYVIVVVVINALNGKV